MRSITATSKNKLHLSPVSKRTICFFLMGFVLGTLIMNLLESTLYAPVSSTFQDIMDSISSSQVHRKDLFAFGIVKNLKAYGLLLFFALTNVWGLYSFGFCLYNGFCHGLLLAFCILLHGFGGMLQYLSFLLPQVFLLIPVYLLIMNHLEKFHKNWFQATTTTKRPMSFLWEQQKRQLLFGQLPFWILCIFLLICAALLEAYVNLPIMEHFNQGL